MQNVFHCLMEPRRAKNLIRNLITGLTTIASAVREAGVLGIRGPDESPRYGSAVMGTGVSGEPSIGPHDAETRPQLAVVFPDRLKVQDLSDPVFKYEN